MIISDGRSEVVIDEAMCLLRALLYSRQAIRRAAEGMRAGFVQEEAQAELTAGLERKEP
jgi:hypothetical protein